MSPVETRLVIGPNASLSPRGAWVFIGSLAAVAAMVAGWSALLGFWLVLPFLGLELLAVGVALWVCLRRNRYREVVEVRGDKLRVEFGLLGRGAGASVEMSRHWSRVRLEPGANRNDPTRLLLVCSGQRVDIGRCLTDEEREQLAARLRQLLRPAMRDASFATGDQSPERLPLGDR